MHALTAAHVKNTREFQLTVNEMSVWYNELAKKANSILDCQTEMWYNEQDNYSILYFH